MSTHPEFYSIFNDLMAEGSPFVSVTMVQAIGSTPQDAGSKILVGGEGLICGTVGGGRVEAKAIAEAQALLAAENPERTRFVEWNLQRDVGMTCGGVVKLYFEVHHHAEWHIAIFGAGHVSQALTRLLLTVPCRLTVVDQRSEWLEKLPAVSRLRKVCVEDMGGLVKQLPNECFVLSMTMGHRTDRPVLEEIFRTRRPFPFLGVIGSKAKAAILRRELLDAGIEDEEIARIHCPVGLPIGTSHPGEIAISIAAQLLKVRDELGVARKQGDVRKRAGAGAV